MTKKKITRISVSQEEHSQTQHIFEQYPQIANNLRMSKDQEQVEIALAEINNLPESAQIVLLQQLSKENQVDAADILTAIHELGPLKSVRKEARRSLIRLESAKIYPSWEPPIDRTPAISVIQPVINPPRFWKGMVAGTRATGMAQLLLFWEQGEDYKEVRILGFYLDFQDEGIKDFFTNLDSKRGTEKYIAEIKANIRTITWRNCELMEGHHLLQSALAVHTRHNTKPPREYQSNLSLIKLLILDAEDAKLDKEGSDLHDLSPQAIVISFVEAWARQDYDMAFDILSKDSPLRKGLSRDEWIERRDAWAVEAVPSDLEPNYIYEREQHKSRLWLPGSFNQSYALTHKEIEAGWSIEMADTPLSDTLPELPKATAVYEESDRHWFWASYTLVQENGEWRIHDMTDEGMIAPNFSVEDLEDDLEELDEQLTAIVEKYTPDEIKKLKDETADSHLQALLTRLMQGTYYTDAIINKLPFDQSNYEFAAKRMLSLGQYERCLAYLIPMIQRFPEERAFYLRQKARVEQRLSRKHSEQGNQVQAERYDELAQESLHESLAIENSFEAHLLLAELLVGNEEYDEAKDHLLQAKDLLANSEESAVRHGRPLIDAYGDELVFSEEEGNIEFHLGEIAWEREEHQEVLHHYQRAAELLPEVPNIWFGIGEAHQALEHFEEAETSYKRAIELAPDNPQYYTTLSEMYAEDAQFSKALKVLEEGLDANPDSIALRLSMAWLYTEMGNFRQAEILLNKAERINPESPLVHSFRKSFNSKKQGQKHATNKLSKPLKHRKRDKGA